MTEVAPLIIAVDATSADKGAVSLDNLSKSAKATEAAADTLAKSARNAMAGVSEAAAASDQAATSTRGLTSAFKGQSEAAVLANSGARQMAEAIMAVQAADRAAAAQHNALVGSTEALAASSRSAMAPLGDLAGKTEQAGMAAKTAAVSYEDFYAATQHDFASAYVKQQTGVNTALIKGGEASKLMSHEMLNLGRQASDVGVSLAMGMNPLMVLVQQGPQIGETLAATSARGITLSGVFKQVAVAGWEMLAPLAPFLLAAAAVAGAVGGVMALAARSLNKEHKDLINTLGLTEKQMERVKNKGVTMGDVWGGTMKYIGQTIHDHFGKQLDWLGKKVSDFLDWSTKALYDWDRGVFAVMGGTIGAIGGAWKALGPLVGAALHEALNIVLAVVEKSINLTIGAINLTLRGARLTNPALQLVPDLKPVKIATTSAQIGDAWASFAKAASDGWQRGSKAWGSGFDNEIDKLKNSILGAARDRILKEAGPPEAAGKAASAAAAASKANKDLIDDQAASYDKLQNSVFQATGAIADQSNVLDQYNQKVDHTADTLSRIADDTRDAAGQMASAFDGANSSLANFARGLGGLLTVYTALSAKEAAIKRQRDADVKAAQKNPVLIAQAEADASRNMVNARVSAYGDMAAAASTFFDQQSDGYRIMRAAEAGFRAFQLAMSIQAQIMATQEAATSVAATAAGVAAKTAAVAPTVAADAATTASGMAAGAAKIFAALGPYGFPIVAAMVATMAALGARSGGGVSGVSISQQRQDAQGTGTVLGDSKAKSDSIAKSLEYTAANTNKMLGFYNPMLAALRSIDNQISVVAAAAARSFSAGGMLDTSKLGLGNSSKGIGLGGTVGLGLLTPFAIGGVLAAVFPGLFGSTTKTTLKDQGIQFSGQTLGDILESGIAGSAYADIVSKTKNKFLGFTTSTSSKKKTYTSALDSDFAQQTNLLIASLRSGVLSAASTLGIQGAEATLDAFKLDLGKISLKDMTGDEITKAIEAVFSKAADQMAGAVLPQLATFQKVGEGLFETLTRLATDYQAVDVNLKSIGLTFNAVGVSSIAAREHLVGLFGSLDDFSSATSFYAENFLTEAERLAPIQNAVTTELARLGLTGIKTRDQFKAVVQGIDVSTAAGADLFAALMNLAPAFAAVTEESKAVTDAKSALSSAYDRESGQIKDTRDKLRDLATSLHSFGQSLYNGPAAALSPEAAYLAAQAEFQRVSGLARTGDQTALGDLQNVSQAYLDASKAYYASSQGYFQDLAAVKDAVTAAEGVAGQQADLAQQQLDQMTATVGQLIDLNENVVTVAQAIAALQLLLGGNGSVTNPTAVPASGTASNDNGAVVEAIQNLQGKVSTTNATLAAGLQQNAAIAEQQDGRLKALEDRFAELARKVEA